MVASGLLFMVWGAPQASAYSDWRVAGYEGCQASSFVRIHVGQTYTGRLESRIEGQNAAFFGIGNALANYTSIRNGNWYGAILNEAVDNPYGYDACY